MKTKKELDERMDRIETYTFELENKIENKIFYNLLFTIMFITIIITIIYLTL